MQECSGAWISWCTRMRSHPLAHSLRQRQGESMTRAEHVFRQVDVHGQQHTLEDQHRHYASVCCESNYTEDDDAHVIIWVGERIHISVPQSNRGKSSLSAWCHHSVQEHHHKWLSLASFHHHWSLQGFQRVGLTTTIWVLMIACMACSILFCLTWLHM